jgi:hypothetical protein
MSDVGRGVFRPGEKVKIFARGGDYFPGERAAGPVLAEGVAADDGSVAVELSLPRREQSHVAPTATIRDGKPDPPAKTPVWALGEVSGPLKSSVDGAYDVRDAGVESAHLLAGTVSNREGELGTTAHGDSRDARKSAA